MATPIGRFIQAYANHRYNPFTEADMAVDKTEDHVPVPTSSPFCLQLVEVPRKDTPSTVSVYCYDSSGYFTEVSSAPAAGQFRVDYPSPDGQGTGMIEFNSLDAGKDLKIVYKATGSPVIAEFLDTFIPWPSATPGENQAVIVREVGGVKTPTWSYLAKRYFHEGPAIYHASGESESCVFFRFKKGTYETKAFLELKGAKLHQGYYTELNEHAHGPGDLATANSGGHSHNIADHNHGPGSLAGSVSEDHQHNVQDVASGAENPATTLNGAGKAVSISGNVAGSGALVTDTKPDHDHAVLYGTTAAAGGSPKTYPDQFKVYIDGVDKTANILALSGLAKLGDGTGTHAFVTTGTGEMDITSLLGGGTIHEIKITEPVSAAGGRALLHLEVY